jgi:hypothetical protein
MKRVILKERPEGVHVEQIGRAGSPLHAVWIYSPRRAQSAAPYQCNPRSPKGKTVIA